MREAINYGDPGVPMTREAYYAWALEQGGRFEQIDGVVVAMAPERIGHSRVKGNLYPQLRAAIRAGGLPCEVFPDGPAVMVDDSAYQPACIVRCADDVLADLPRSGIISWSGPRHRGSFITDASRPAKLQL